MMSATPSGFSPHPWGGPANSSHRPIATLGCCLGKAHSAKERSTGLPHCYQEPPGLPGPCLNPSRPLRGSSDPAKGEGRCPA